VGAVASFPARRTQAAGWVEEVESYNSRILYRPWLEALQTHLRALVDAQECMEDDWSPAAVAAAQSWRLAGRGLHSSAFKLNLSRF